jgi:hypothetical protein
MGIINKILTIILDFILNRIKDALWYSENVENIKL